MSIDKNPTLVLGGTGKTGRRVAKRLAALGVPVRIGSRNGNPPFDWNDLTTWRAPLRDVRAVYITYQPDLAVPGALSHVRTFAQHAVASGVSRLVLLSGRGEPQVFPSEAAVADAAREGGATFTILRAAWFCQNFSEGTLLGPVLAGEVAFPAGDVAEPFIDADDIADVAVAALTSDAHEGKIYDLTGPRSITFAEAVSEISRAAERPVRYVPVTSEQYRDSLAPYVPAEQANFLVELFRDLLDGHNTHTTDTVERVLGRRPRDFRDFARDAASAWSCVGG